MLRTFKVFGLRSRCINTISLKNTLLCDASIAMVYLYYNKLNQQIFPLNKLKHT